MLQPWTWDHLTCFWSFLSARAYTTSCITSRHELMINEDIKNSSTYTISSLNKSCILIKNVDTWFQRSCKNFAAIAHSNFSDAYLTNIWRLEDGINKRFDDRIKSTKTLPNSHQANVYLWSMLSFLTRFWFVWNAFAVVFQLAQRTKFKQSHKRCILLSQKHKLFRSFVLVVWAFLRSSLLLESNNPDTSGLASKTFTSWEH